MFLLIYRCLLLSISSLRYFSQTILVISSHSVSPSAPPPPPPAFPSSPPRIFFLSVFLANITRTNRATSLGMMSDDEKKLQTIQDIKDLLS